MVKKDTTLINHDLLWEFNEYNWLQHFVMPDNCSIILFSTLLSWCEVSLCFVCSGSAIARCWHADTTHQGQFFIFFPPHPWVEIREGLLLANSRQLFLRVAEARHLRVVEDFLAKVSLSECMCVICCTVMIQHTVMQWMQSKHIFSLLEWKLLAFIFIDVF